MAGRCTTPEDCVRDCSGLSGLYGRDLFSFWARNDCPGAYSAYLNSGKNGTLGYNPARLDPLQRDIVNLFAVYSVTNTITDQTDDPQYNSFQEKLLDLCLDPRLPGVCDKYLGYTCPGSREEVMTSRIWSNFCGCYVPPDPSYVEANIMQSEEWEQARCYPTEEQLPAEEGKMSRSCDPLCHRASTVQKSCANTGSFLTCNQNICAIDEVSVNLARAEIGGGVTFANICPGCNAGNGCICIISGVDVTDTLSSIGVGTQFKQLCGPKSVCLQLDSEGTILSSDCDKINPGGPPVPFFRSWPSLAFLFFVAFVVVVIMIVFFATLGSNKPKTTGPSSSWNPNSSESSATHSWQY